MQSVCPECETANPVENLYCSKCGSSMEGATLVQELDAAEESPPQEEKRKKRRWPLIIGAIVVLCLCGTVGVGLLGGSSDDGEPAAGTVAPTVVVDATEVPATEAPVATEVPPTEAPLPTEPAEPTDVPVPATNTPEPEGPSAEVQVYALEMADKLGTFSKAMIELGGLMMEPQLGDQDWVIDAAVQVTVIRLAHEELEEMEVPPEMREVHEAVLAATGDGYEAMGHLTSGVDNLDVDEINRAVELLLSAEAKMLLVSPLIEETMSQWQ